MGETTFRETLSSWPKTFYSFAATSPLKASYSGKDEDEQLSLMESESKRPALATRPSTDGWRSPLRLRFSLPPSISSGSQSAWLLLYFLSNLSLTLYNKFVLVRFPFPYTLTALHALCGSIGGYILMERGAFEPKQLSLRENMILCAFSMLYTINIAVSNLSLGLVTVPVSGAGADDARRTQSVVLVLPAFDLDKVLLSRFSYSFIKLCALRLLSSSWLYPIYFSIPDIRERN